MKYKCSSDTDDLTKVESFELLRAAEQALTFNCLRSFMSHTGVDFTKVPEQELHFKTKDGFYSNLAQLLSDQNRFVVSFDVFGLDDWGSRWEYLHHEDVDGAMTFQLLYLFRNFEDHGLVESIRNMEQPEDLCYFPFYAVREAVINAFEHCDYPSGRRIFVEAYPDRMEITSSGGLVGRLHLSDIQNGIAIPRNKYLAQAFEILKLSYGIGDGMRIINRCYKDFEEKPEFIAKADCFKVILPLRKTPKADQANCWSETEGIEKPSLAERLIKYKEALPYKTAQEIEEDRQWLGMPPIGRELL